MAHMTYQTILEANLILADEVNNISNEVALQQNQIVEMAKFMDQMRDQK